MKFIACHIELLRDNDDWRVRKNDIRVSECVLEDAIAPDWIGPRTLHIVTGDVPGMIPSAMIPCEKAIKPRDWMLVVGHIDSLPGGRLRSIRARNII